MSNRMTNHATPGLVIGISSRALFNLSLENEIYETEGIAAYAAYQREHEDEILSPGSGFPLVKALLDLNHRVEDQRIVEVIVMSRNSADTGVRLFKSIQAHNLDITRAAFTSGAPLAPYLKAFKIDLFLSRYEDDVWAAIEAGIAGAVIYDPPEGFVPDDETIRIAFDGDAVLFGAESDEIYHSQGLAAWERHEVENALTPLPEGPFAKFLRTIAFLQNYFDPSPIRTALVTARQSPAHERVIRTLRAWDIRIDEAFFMGGLSKDEVLQAFQAHIFFDDLEANLISASHVVPSARVPRSATTQPDHQA
jgi:5'-nucleotidase